MGITSALVLLAVIWFMTFFIVLPIRIQGFGGCLACGLIPGRRGGVRGVGKGRIRLGIKLHLRCRGALEALAPARSLKSQNQGARGRECNAICLQEDVSAT